MVSSVICWYDVLVWGKWEYFGQWSTIVQYVRVCLTDADILYYSRSHIVQLHVMTPYYSTWTCLSIVQQREQSIHSIRFHFHMRRGHMMFFQKVPCVWAECFNMLKYTSIIFKWSLVESLFNIFISSYLNLTLTFIFALIALI